MLSIQVSQGTASLLETACSPTASLLLTVPTSNRSLTTTGELPRLELTPSRTLLCHWGLVLISQVGESPAASSSRNWFTTICWSALV